MHEQLASQFTASAAVVLVIQWLKKSRFAPFMNFETDAINKAVATLAAAFTAAGIHYTFDSSTHTLVVTGLTLGAFAHGAWHWLTGFSFQELIYHGAIKPKNGQPHPLALEPPKA